MTWRRLIAPLLACGIVGWSASAWADVTLDAVTPGASLDAATTLTISHTVGAGCANAVVYLLFAVDVITDSTSGNQTFGGATMTRVSFFGQTGVSGYIYRLVNPTKGSAQDAVITITPTEGIAGTVISVCGAHQTTPERDVDQVDDATVGAFTTPTVDSAVGDFVIAMLAGAVGSATSTWTAPATERSDLNSAVTDTVHLSTGTAPGEATSIAISGTNNSNTIGTVHIVSVQSAPSTTRRRVFMTY